MLELVITGGMHNTTAQRFLTAEFSSDGGATFPTGANTWGQSYIITTGTGNAAGSVSETLSSANISLALFGNQTKRDLAGVIRIFPATASSQFYLMQDMQGSNTSIVSGYTQVRGALWRLAPNVSFNYVRFTWSSAATWAAGGIFTLYGYKNT